MGEDFIRRRQRQFKRCMDRAFESMLKHRDLFSDVPAEQSQTVTGFVLAGTRLEVGQSLWQAPTKAAARDPVFCLGASPAVELSGEAAAVAARLKADCGSPLTATVVNLPGAGLAELSLHKPFLVN